MAAHSDQLTVAAVQTCPQLGMISANLADSLRKIDQAAHEGATLLAFPELSLSGYLFDSLDEASSVAETVPGPATEILADKCASLGLHVVVGLIEEDCTNYYNTAALIGPDGLVGKYRKTHLPQLGVDRFVKPGNLPYTVFDTPLGKLGVLICYDVHHPEPLRCLALDGAEVVISLSNYPVGIAFMPQYVLPTRVIENRVHLIGCNRVGEERGCQFIGSSMILDADSTVIATATRNQEDIIYGRLDVGKSRSKAIKAGNSAVDLFADRRPELYATICRARVQ
jgi:predicted amidohydrolase